MVTRFITAFVASAVLAWCAPGPIRQGSLLVRGSDGAGRLECPLKHTDVKAEISGFIARVTVTQDFENSAADKVDAIYVFPLPHNAAVDDMTLQVGTRKVRGVIKRREEALSIYNAARNAGQVAALLDQERPNIFTQSVANIEPRAKVRVTISYVERLNYEAGVYEFTFPMVVGPRYIPMARGIDARVPVESKDAPAAPGGGWKWETSRVPDAARISPPVAGPNQRAGHDISLEVKLDAGVPVENLDCKTHEVNTERPSKSKAIVRLRDQQSIPNKDFVLRYAVAGRKISDAVLTHKDERGGFFSLILQPPDKVATTDVSPKEIVFVLDTSGSMSGFPIEKAKEAMGYALNDLNPQDTFNLITFAGDTEILFPAPVSATQENLAKARRFLASRRGSGGTEMMKAIQAALQPTNSQKHVRIVCFMTDGYVGNEEQIIREVGLHPNARVFSFGIGSSVNRYLLDSIAEKGRGEVEYVSLNDDGSAAAKRFHERVRNPLLTDVSVEWNGLPVADVLPARLPDLFSAKPLVITGRYTGPGKGTIRLRGKLAGAPVSRDIPVDFTTPQQANAALATLWARTQIDALRHVGGSQPSIIDLGLQYRLMTHYTSFVAVEDTVITEGGSSRRVQVPVEIPEGVSYEGIFGGGGDMVAMQAQPAGANLATYRESFVDRAAAVFRGAPKSAHVTAVAPPPPPPASVKTQAVREVVGQTKIDESLLRAPGAQQVRVLIRLKNDDATVLASLKKLGAEILGQTKSARVVIVKVMASKLQEIAKLDAVTWISPAN